MRNVDYSERLAFNQGEKRQFKLSFLKPKGPRGGRNVISKLRVRCDVVVSTNAATTIAQGGWANFLQQIKIVGPMGEFVNLTGPEVRMLHYAEAGRDAIPDPASAPINSAGIARTIEWILDFAPRRRAKRRWDYAVPVDHLLTIGDQAIELRSASAADIGTGGGTTITSQTYQLVVETREESDIQNHVWRELRSLAQNQLTDFELPVSNGYIRSCYGFKYADHATGGADVSSATAIMIPTLSVDSVDPTFLQNAFLDEGGHDRSSVNDPFVQTTRRVLPLVFPSGYEKLTDMPQHPSRMAIRLTGNTQANVSLVFELIYERTPKAMAVELQLADKLNLTAASVKTEGKTKRDRASWGDMANVMPGKLVQ